MQAEQSRAPYYIKFHLGDYARDADHLSMLQEGAYLRLMRWYYGTARPIPNDLERIYRRCMAMSVEEQQAVRYILEEFFLLDGPVWRHKRIDEELKAWEKLSTAAKLAVEAREKKKSQQINETELSTDDQPMIDRSSNQNQNHITPPYSPSSRPASAWWQSERGIEQKGLELGIQAKAGESYSAYKDRLFASLKTKA